MAKRAYVDKENCIGCGLCAEMFEGVFYMDDLERSCIKDGTSPKSPAIKEAAGNCPVNAIKIEEVPA